MCFIIVAIIQFCLLLHIASMKLGKAVVYVRRRKGISQNQLARDSETNRGYLYKLENDQVSPTISKLEELCAVLGVSVSSLIGIAEKQERGELPLLPADD